MSSSIRPSGALTLDTATAHISLLDSQLVAGAHLIIDFSDVSDVDSSAVALLLAWSRKARAQGATLEWAALPDNLSKLVAVYGLSELLLAP